MWNDSDGINGKMHQVLTWDMGSWYSLVNQESSKFKHIKSYPPHTTECYMKEADHSCSENLLFHIDLCGALTPSFPSPSLDG